MSHVPYPPDCADCPEPEVCKANNDCSVMRQIRHPKRAPAAHPAAHQESAPARGAHCRAPYCYRQLNGASECAVKCWEPLADPEQPSAALADELAKRLEQLMGYIMQRSNDNADRLIADIVSFDMPALLAALRHPEPAPRGEPVADHDYRSTPDGGPK